MSNSMSWIETYFGDRDWLIALPPDESEWLASIGTKFEAINELSEATEGTFGFECLFLGSGQQNYESAIERIDNLQIPRADFDLLCILVHARSIRTFLYRYRDAVTEEQRLRFFVNVSNAIVADEDTFSRCVKEFQEMPQGVVFELTEEVDSNVIERVKELKNIYPLVQFGLDDTGEMKDIVKDFLVEDAFCAKMDHKEFREYFSRLRQAVGARDKLIKRLERWSSSECHVVVEGVTRTEERQFLRSSFVEKHNRPILIQGYGVSPLISGYQVFLEPATLGSSGLRLKQIGGGASQAPSVTISELKRDWPEVEFPEYVHLVELNDEVIPKLNELIGAIEEKGCDLVFNLSNVHWIDLLPMAILPVLVRTANLKGCRVHIKLPNCARTPEEDEQISKISFQLRASGESERGRLLKNLRNVEKRYTERQRVISFLDKRDFFRILSGLDVDHNFEEVKGQVKGWAEPETQTQILDLRSFEGQRALDKFVQSLNDEEQLTGYFTAYTDLNYVKSGEFATILLWELGENVELHAKARNGGEISEPPAQGVIACRVLHELVDSESGTKTEKQIWRVKHSIEWEAEYFKSHPYEGFLDVVVVDDGPGILATLTDDYKEYLREEGNAEEDVAEVEVLKYAFQEYSSRDRAKRRTRQEYKPTGLHKVRNVVKEYNGMILLRSGRNCVVYDFSSDPEGGKPYVNSQLPKLRGTQVEIMLPLSRQAPARRSRRAPGAIAEHYRKIGEPLSIYNLWTDLHNRSSLHALIKERIRKLKPGETLTLDLDRVFWHKDVFRLFFKTVTQCTFGHKIGIICLNLDPRLVPVVRSINNVEYPICSQIVLVVDQILRPTWVGASSREEWRLLDALFENGELEETDLISVLPRDTHIEPQKFVSRIAEVSLVRGKGKKWGIYPFVYEVEQFLNHEFEVAIQQGLRSHDCRHAGLHWVPSGYYTDPYLEASRLFDDAELRRKIFRRFREIIERNEIMFDLVLSATDIGAKIVNELSVYYHAERFVFRDFHAVEVEQIHLPRKGCKVLVVTDLIQSGSLVRRICERARKEGLEIVATICMVDVSTKTPDLGGIPLFYLVRIPDSGIPIFPELPPNWSQRPIKKVDARTLTVVDEVQHKCLMSEDEFWSLAERCAPISKGHFSLEEHHFDFYDHADIILSSEPFRTKILERIAQSLTQAEVGVVVYPNMSFARLLVSMLAVELKIAISPVCAVECSSSGTSPYGLSQVDSARLKGQNVLIFDDGANTGGTLYSLILQSLKAGASEIHILVVMNRMGAERTADFVRLAFPGGPPVFFYSIYDLVIPVYTNQTCQICAKRKICQRLLWEFGDRISPLLHKTVTQILKASEPVDMRQRTSQVHGRVGVTDDMIVHARLEDSFRKIADPRQLFAQLDRGLELSNLRVALKVLSTSPVVLGNKDLCDQLGAHCETALAFKEVELQRQAFEALAQISPEWFIERFLACCHAVADSPGCYAEVVLPFFRYPGLRRRACDVIPNLQKLLVSPEISADARTVLQNLVTDLRLLGSEDVLNANSE